MFWDGTQWVEERAASPHSTPSALVTWLATLAMLAVLPAALILASSVDAGTKTASSVWVVELSGSTLVPASLHHGDHFTVGYSTRERQPWGLATCYPNATTTYAGTYADGSMWSEVFSLWDGGPTPQAFVLGESVYPLWTDGGADCTVSLVKYSRDLSRQTVLATYSFVVAP